MDNRQNRFPGPDEGFPEDMDEMEDLNPALPDADEILDGLGEDFRFDPDDYPFGRAGGPLRRTR